MTAHAAAAIEVWEPKPVSQREWTELARRAPQLVATMRRYLIQLTTFLAPRSVDAADQTLPTAVGVSHSLRDHRPVSRATATSRSSSPYAALISSVAAVCNIRTLSR